MKNLISMIPNALAAVEEGAGNVPSRAILQYCGDTGVPSALGCIPVNNANILAANIAKISLSLGGAIALITIVIASYQMMTSQGDPRRLQAARELMFAAISGVILLALAAFAFRLIGVDILGLF